MNKQYNYGKCIYTYEEARESLNQGHWIQSEYMGQMSYHNQESIWLFDSKGNRVREQEKEKMKQGKWKIKKPWKCKIVL